MGLINTGSTEDAQIKKYVIENIDAAIKNGWTMVYYQPIIRTLTGQLCGAESLARWKDPVHGFLGPGQFIEALEESNQIHKLDCWIVDKVCSDIADRINQQLGVVPVSVNFSKLDFEATDMLKVVEDTVEKYDIPKDYIHIEITESMIVSDANLMTKIIDDFRSAGYEVWMDDFGSGYSSLNLLKDYHFDTLKMDMEFLSSFTDRSKAIMTSAITMSKDIDIMTLAEGVETQEQVEFLYSIGCGKLQGYFYGRPMPMDEFFAHIENRGITLEPRQWRHYYQIASFHARHTEEPLEIIEDDGTTFRTLFMNEAYKRQIMSKDYSLEKLDEFVYHTNSPLVKKYREYANIIESTKNMETFYYTNDGSIMCFRGQELVEHDGKHIIEGSIRNISADKNWKKQTNVDNKLKELNHLFETVMIVNTEKSTITPLLGEFKYTDASGKEASVLEKQLENMLNYHIAAADREKFTDFFDLSTLKERIDASGKGYVENIFRIKQQDGNYQWKELSIMLIPGTSGKEYLFCTKATADNAQRFLSENNSIYNPKDYGLNSDDNRLYFKLWENTVNDSSIKFYWKDKQYRYLGASRAFLDFFQVTIDDIRGKTAGELGWCLDEKTYESAEKEIITKGAQVMGQSAQCVIKGLVYNVMCFKRPLYENGQIIGLMGYFIDVDEELGRLDKLYNERRLDSVTGLMNVNALGELSKSYAHNYATHHENYAQIILRNEKHHRIVEDYGQEFGNKLLKRMGEVILEVAGGSCAIAKCLGADFAIVTSVSKKVEVELLVQHLVTKLENIKKIDGNDVTVRINIAYKLRDEEGITDENIYSAVLQELL